MLKRTCAEGSVAMSAYAVIRDHETGGPMPTVSWTYGNYGCLGFDFECCKPEAPVAAYFEEKSYGTETWRRCLS